MSSINLVGRDRNTPYRDKGMLNVPVAAGEVIPAGFIVVVNAAGYAELGTAATGLTYIGRAEEFVDNTDGLNGDVSILVKTDKAFQFANSSTDPVTQASFGKLCYIANGETVAETDASGTLSPAGIVVGIDQDGVWVQ